MWSSRGWEVITITRANGIRDVHVVPVDDEKGHEEERCGCGAKVERYENGNSVTVHNAFDGREIVERAVDEVERSRN